MRDVKALVIGIDHYYNGAGALGGCVNDAQAVAACLEFNDDEINSGNADIDLLVSSGDERGVEAQTLQRRIFDFFASRGAKVAILYFSGHGFMDDGGDGYIGASDLKQGMRMSSIVRLANESQGNLSRVIILDCCNAGGAGDNNAFRGDGECAIGSGTTILTSSDRSQVAREGRRHGLFTELLLDALAGGAADICGNITPASVYAYIDQTLRNNEQRPIYKANVRNFVTLRRVAPKISLNILRNLPTHFPSADHFFKLDSSYEPDRKHVNEKLDLLPVDEAHVVVFKELQKFNRQGLVVPVGEADMFFAAVRNTGCVLTALGKHYRRLVLKRQI
jgi:hypothetical protein